MSDVNQLRKYRGQDVLTTTVRDCIGKEGFWSRLYDDLVSKGVQTMTLQPELESLLTKLEADKLEPDVLALATEKVPHFKKVMRQGCTADLEKVFYKKAVETAKSFMSGEVSASGFGLTYLENLTVGLQFFKDTPGVLQVVQKLESYKKKELTNLSSQEILLVLKKYPADPLSDFPAEHEADGFEPLLKKLASLLDQVTEFSGGKQHLKTAVLWHFRFLHSQLEAGWKCPGAWVVQKDYSPYIVCLKAVISKCAVDQETAEGAPASDIFTKDLLAWLGLSLEAFQLLQTLLGETASLGTLQQTLGSLSSLLRTNRVLANVLQKLEDLEAGSLPAVRLGQASVQQWGWTQKAKALLRDATGFHDAVDVEASKLKECCEESLIKLKKAAKNMFVHDSEECWKSSLANDASLSEVLSSAQEDGSLSSLDGTLVDQCIGSFEQASFPETT
ncbi:Uncharacterized protein SCF082_LOCUS17742 [Durusdinium trenchii]